MRNLQTWCHIWILRLWIWYEFTEWLCFIFRARRVSWYSYIMHLLDDFFTSFKYVYDCTFSFTQICAVGVSVSGDHGGRKIEAGRRGGSINFLSRATGCTRHHATTGHARHYATTGHARHYASTPSFEHPPTHSTRTYARQSSDELANKPTGVWGCHETNGRCSSVSRPRVQRGPWNRHTATNCKQDTTAGHFQLSDGAGRALTWLVGPHGRRTVERDSHRVCGWTMGSRWRWSFY